MWEFINIGADKAKSQAINPVIAQPDHKKHAADLLHLL